MPPAAHRPVPNAAWRAALVAAALLGGVPPAVAEDTSAALGYFETAAVRVPIADGYAFVASSLLGGGDVLLVAVSNAGFEQAAIDRYWDRRYQLEQFFADAETALVWLEFDHDGRFRGFAYRFSPHDACGYCAGDVESSVARTGDRLVGTVRQIDSGDGRAFEITLELPISPDDHGAAQGVEGGEPGRAYLAYHRALVADRRERLRELLSAERRRSWDEALAAGAGERFLAFLNDGRPATVRVSAAYVDGERALVLLTGERDGGAIRGEAQLVLEEGGWRFVEETIAPVAD